MVPLSRLPDHRPNCTAGGVAEDLAAALQAGAGAYFREDDKLYYQAAGLLQRAESAQAAGGHRCAWLVEGAGGEGRTAASTRRGSAGGRRGRRGHGLVAAAAVKDTRGRCCVVDGTEPAGRACIAPPRPTPPLPPQPTARR